MGIDTHTMSRNRFLRCWLRWSRQTRCRVLLAAGALAVIPRLGSAISPVFGRAVELVSVSILGVSGNNASNGVAVNADGSLVAFYSDATDLVAGDANHQRDVFLRNRVSGTTELISVNSAGIQANRDSHATGFPPAIDGDGQIVAFYSDATNLVPLDVNGQPDVFVRLRQFNETHMVSFTADGSQGNGASLNPSINRDGHLVAFQSQASNMVPNDTNEVSDIFVRDTTANTTERVCNQIQGNGSSSTPSISADGNFVAFTSAATNLVPGDVNGHLDIFVCDRRTGAIDLVSVSTQGVQGDADSILPAISEDGRFVAFKSEADNLVPNDRNGVVDVFVRDRLMRTTERVSVNVLGNDSNAESFPPSISYDGRFVAFGSAASNLVTGDSNGVSDVFVRDLHQELTLIVDVNDRGEQANAGTPDVPPSVSGDGMQIGYISLASNLVTNDHNETIDVFIQGNPFFCGICPAPLVCVNNECAVFTPVAMTPTPTPTGGTTPTGSGTPAGSVTPTPGQIGSVTPTGSTTPEGSFTPTGSVTPTGSTTPTAVVTPTGSAIPMGSFTPTGSVTPIGSFTQTAPATATRTGTATATASGTATATNTATATATASASQTATRGISGTPTRTSSPVATAAPGRTFDRDACHCAVSPEARASRRGGVLWLCGIAALVWRRRRFHG